MLKPDTEKESSEWVDLDEIGEDFMPTEADIDAAREFARSIDPMLADMFDAEEATENEDS